MWYYYEVNYQNKYNHSTIQMEIRSAATNTYERKHTFFSNLIRPKNFIHK